MPGEFKRELSVNINTNVNTQKIQDAERIIQSFFDKYDGESLKLGIDTKKAKVDAKDFTKAILRIKELSEEISLVKTNSPSMLPAIKNDIEYLSRVRDEFSSVFAVFNDGSMANGLDNVMKKISEGFSVTMVDIGERVNYLKSQISSALNELENLNLEKYGDGSFDFSSKLSSRGEISERIKMLKTLIEYQSELEQLQGRSFQDYEAPLKWSTDSVSSVLNTLENEYQEIVKNNLLTREQLEMRKELITKTLSYSWTPSRQKKAIENVQDEESYQKAIESLRNYIEERKKAIAQIQAHEQDLFSDDGIAKHINTANQSIQRFQGYIKELETIKTGGTTGGTAKPLGDLSSVIEGLSKIEVAITSVVNAFKPLTDALASEDSALSAMVKSNVSDLELLNSKFKEVFSNIESLSNKEVNITNVISDGKNNQSNLDQIRQFRQEAKSLFTEVQELYNEAIFTGNKLNGSEFGPVNFLEFSNTMADFDMMDLAKRIKSRSANSLGIVIDELNEWKKVLLQFNNLRNNVEAGSFNVSKYTDDSSKVKIGSKTTDKDGQTLVNKNTVNNEDVLNKVKNLSGEIEQIFTSIRSKIEETFDLSTINPKTETIKNITEEIYQQFINLQSKIGALEFILQPPKVDKIVKTESDDIKNAANAMNEEGESAGDAVPKKNAFTEANQKAAASADATKIAAEGAAEGIKAEAQAAEQASRAYDRVTVVSDSDKNPKYASMTKSSVGANSVNTLTQNYIHDDDGWKLNTETLVKDYKAYDKLQTDAQKKIEKAQAMLQKFMSQFDNKTAGQWSNTGLYKELQGTLKNGIGSVDDIDAVINKMQLLDAEYNKVVQSFRQGTKSMNPFVNAFNSMDEMDNKVKQIQLDFNTLKFPENDLTEAVGGLPSLLTDLKTKLDDYKNGKSSIQEVADAYGKLNAAVKAANTAISTQRKDDAAKTSQLKAQEDAYNNAIKAQEKLYNLKKQMVELDPQSSKGQETMRKITEAQNEYNEALSKTNRQLLTIGQLQKIENSERQQQVELSARQKEYKAKVSAEQEAKDLEYVLSLYKKYTDAATSLKTMQSDPSGAVHTKAMAASIEAVKKAKEELLSLGIDVNNISANELLTEQQKIALLQAQIQYKKQIKNIENTTDDKAATQQNKQNLNYGKTIFNRESRYAGVITGNLASLGDTQLTDSFLAKLEQYKAAYKELETLRNTFANSPTAANDGGLTTKFQESALSVERLRKELILAFNEYQKFTNIPEGSLLGESVMDASKFSNAKTAMIDFASSVTDGKFKLEGFNAAGTEMYGVMDKGHGVFTKVTVKMDQMTGEMKAFESGTNKVTSSWSKLGNELQNGVQRFTRMYLSFYAFIRMIKQGVNYVKEIDLAMTELKKVTNETDEAYSYFLKNASQISSVIGSTVSDFTDATAAFARLGYTINEATGMAESAIVYKNVADGLDSVEAATESIISTMAAFGIEANDTMSIVDKFNAVGKIYCPSYIVIYS